MSRKEDKTKKGFSRRELIKSGVALGGVALLAAQPTISTARFRDGDGRDGSTNSPATTPFVAVLPTNPNLSQKPVFDIRDYGAMVDGVTNDAPAVTAAIAAAVAAFGGTVFFPRGTTRISSTVTGNGSGGYNPGLILAGEAGGSRVKFKNCAGYGFSLGTFSEIIKRDLYFTGDDDGNPLGASSTAATDVEIIAIHETNVQKSIYQNCFFMGIGADGILNVENGTLDMRDCFFGACSAPLYGCIPLYICQGAYFENVQFIDYASYAGIYWNKLSVHGNNPSWISCAGTPAISGSIPRPSFVFKNCQFDENTTDAFIRLVGTSEHSVLIENCAGATGLGGFGRMLNLTTFRKVTVKDTFMGYHGSLTEHASCLFTDVETVEFDNVLHKYGAKFITLAGTTKRFISRNSSLNPLTHPTGVQNTANAFIDADHLMPATASAAALAPLAAVTHVTGTTNITSITTTNLKPGDTLTLIFNDILRVKDGSNLKLNGNFVTSADDVLVLKYDGSNFYELSRSLN